MKTASRLGLQLYSVRDEVNRDFRETLRRIAGFGVEGVEIGLLDELPASLVRGWLDDASLVAISSHVFLELFEEHPDRILGEAEILGHRRVVISWIESPASADQANSFVVRLERAAEKARERGFELAFHNHDGEFARLDDGTRFFDRIVADAPSVALELDLGWAWMAGEDLPTLVASVGDRCSIAHVKDFAHEGNRGSFVAVGEGSVPFFAALRAQSPEWLVAEQDDAFEPDQLTAAARSCKALAELRDRLAVPST